MTAGHCFLPGACLTVRCLVWQGLEEQLGQPLQQLFEGNESQLQVLQVAKGNPMLLMRAILQACSSDLPLRVCNPWAAIGCADRSKQHAEA